MSAATPTLADVIERLDRIEQRLAPAVASDWMTREEAETYLNFSRATFLRQRAAHPVALAPACEHPLRFSRKALDLLKLTGGVVPNATRRGRRPNGF